MTNNEIKTIYGFLSRIKVTKVTDKATRGQIIATHLAFHKAATGIDADVREIQRMFASGNEDRLMKHYADVRDGGKGDAEMAELNAKLNEAVSLKLAEQNDADFPKIAKDGLIEALAEQEMDITCADLVFLSPILSE